MGAARVIFIVYVFYTVLALVSAINTKFIDLLPGILLMWTVLFFFILGGFLLRFSALPAIPAIPANCGANKISLFLIPLSVSAALYAARFYTGSGFSDVFSTILHGGSNYNNYQVYFSEMSLQVFSLNKVPPILSMMIMKLSLVYVFLDFFIYRRASVFVVRFASLCFVTFSYVYFSIARGTSFEIFEILLIIIFCVGLRGGWRVFNRKYFFVFLSAVFSLIIYSYNISSRYEFDEVDLCMTSVMCQDAGSAIYKISPVIGELTVKLSLYFSFGIYYLSKLIDFYLSLGIEGLVLLTLPWGAGLNPALASAHMCKDLIDCGASWAPGFERVIYTLGLPGSLIFISLLGGFSRVLYIKAISGGVVSAALLYFIFLLMVSLPVGNFVTDSSSSMLSLFALLIVFCFRRLIYRRV